MCPFEEGRIVTGLPLRDALLPYDGFSSSSSSSASSSRSITGAGTGLGFTVFDAAALLVAFFAGVFVFDFRTVFFGVLELAGSVFLLLLLVGADFDNPNLDAPW